MIRSLSVTRSLAPNIPPDLMPILPINLPELICTVWLGIWSQLPHKVRIVYVLFYFPREKEKWQKLEAEGLGKVRGARDGIKPSPGGVFLRFWLPCMFYRTC